MLIRQDYIYSSEYHCSKSSEKRRTFKSSLKKAEARRAPLHTGFLSLRKNFQLIYYTI